MLLRGNGGFHQVGFNRDLQTLNYICLNSEGCIDLSFPISSKFFPSTLPLTPLDQITC